MIPIGVSTKRAYALFRLSSHYLMLKMKGLIVVNRKYYQKDKHNLVPHQRQYNQGIP